MHFSPGVGVSFSYFQDLASAFGRKHNENHSQGVCSGFGRLHGIWLLWLRASAMHFSSGFWIRTWDFFFLLRFLKVGHLTGSRGWIDSHFQTFYRNPQWSGIVFSWTDLFSSGQQDVGLLWERSHDGHSNTLVVILDTNVNLFSAIFTSQKDQNYPHNRGSDFDDIYFFFFFS
jgi:hypothetical protein